MASYTGPPVYVPASELPPDRMRGYGLQSQAFVVEETGRPSKSIRGVEHEVINCGDSGLNCWSHDCNHFGDKFADQKGQSWVRTTPFTVYATGPNCSGRHAIEQGARRATERLAALEWAAVEWAVQTGACGVEPYLIGPPEGGDGIELFVRPGSVDGLTALASWNVLSDAFAPELPAGTTPVSRADALAYIEWGMRHYGGTGIIHAPSYTYPYFHDWEIRDGARLVTQIGTGWAFGRGYVNIAPGSTEVPDRDTPPDLSTAWLYGTGAVRIWRSAIQRPPEPDNGPMDYNFRDNRSMPLAERHYTASIQCPYVAVNVDLTQ